MERVVTGAGLLRPDQVATILGVSVNTLAIWRHNRRGPSFLKFGRQVRYPSDVIDEFLERSRRVCNPEISRKR
ncbi:helix-turn-helix domain-containing protein [Microbacterium immunditiarum]|uniref:Putative DNA-binding transcriptional regulator AlpA n=1 Tax=Microbacterium immunditiarum TaxID=337480 RepID=A0A7Y9GK84_9MICO|nr:helix-turn-helix domain-containing protein [Microbacterium immunditiarum]NYE18060.1 putative DNA-binding transcriptional regulator AlpA [Microbacterium immunditiarum]